MKKENFIDKIIFFAQPWLSFLSFPPNLIPDISTLKVLEKNPSTDLTKCCAHKNEDEKYFQDKQKVFASRLYLLSLKYLLSILASKFLCAHCNCSTNCYRSQNYEAGSVQSRSFPEDINFFCRFNCDVDKFKEIVFFAPYKSDALSEDICSSGLWGDNSADEDRLWGEKKEKKCYTQHLIECAAIHEIFCISLCVMWIMIFSWFFLSDAPMRIPRLNIRTGMDEGLRKSMNNVSERWSDRFFPP